jgi:hypothetical protein
VITFDMGGTTAKASLIEDGQLSRADEYEVGGGISLSSKLSKGGGYALKLPVIDISEVGTGGGSIVWIDRPAWLKVGPHSAGAVPGPACYGAGNDGPTVTDANVVLGYLNPTRSPAARCRSRRRSAMRAIGERVAAPLRVGLDEAAWSVFVVAAANMVRAVKAVSTYRGRNPSDFVLMAFGGNGGVFAAELLRQLQIKRALVPAAAGVFSAVGLCSPICRGQRDGGVSAAGHAGAEPGDARRVFDSGSSSACWRCWALQRVPTSRFEPQAGCAIQGPGLRADRALRSCGADGANGGDVRGIGGGIHRGTRRPLRPRLQRRLPGRDRQSAPDRRPGAVRSRPGRISASAAAQAAAASTRDGYGSDPATARSTTR